MLPQPFLNIQIISQLKMTIILPGHSVLFRVFEGNQTKSGKKTKAPLMLTLQTQIRANLTK